MLYNSYIGRIFIMKRFGLGCMRLPLLNKEDPTSVDMEYFCKMVDEFLANGFVYFDTAYMYHGNASEIVVREGLVKRHPRESFILADKLPLLSVKMEGDKERIFEEQLEKTGVDYFDYYLLHNVNTNTLTKANRFDCFNFIKQKKEEGIVKHIGFSYHDNAELLDQILTEHPEIEFVQIQFNYLDYENTNVQSRKCYETIVKHGKRVWIMEPVKGGMLADPIDEVKELLKANNPNASPSSWALRFAASQPAVDMVLSGMSNMDQLHENMALMNNFVPLTDEEKAVLKKASDIINSKTAVPCTGCAYCVPECPKNIAIPEYFSLYNAAKAYRKMPNQQAYYGNYIRTRGRASDCIECHSCEKACPQHIKISEMLKGVAEMFEPKKKA